MLLRSLRRLAFASSRSLALPLAVVLACTPRPLHAQYGPGYGGGGSTTYTGTNDLGGATVTLAGAIFNNATVTNGTIFADELASYNGTNIISATLAGGTLIVTYPSTLKLTADNTYTGGTVLSGGTLEFSTLGNFGSGSISGSGTTSSTLRWATGATTDISSRLAATINGLTFDTNGNNVTFANALRSQLDNGGGVGRNLEKTGSGTLTLAAVNNAANPSGGTGDLGFTVAAGTLALGVSQSGTAGFYVTVNSGATFDLAGYSSNVTALNGSGSVTLGSGSLTLGGGTFSGILSGTGSVVVAGTPVIAGAFTHTGGTTITSGTLVIGAGGTTGSIVGNITNNAALGFARSDNFTFANVISGTGGVIQNGPGTLTLTGANTYAGGTTVSGGTLAVSSLAPYGSGGFSVTTGGTLDAGSGTLSFDRAVTIDGAGSRLISTGAVEFGTPGAGSLSVTNGGADIALREIVAEDENDVRLLRGARGR
jgi:autotransporter-associated beta strand protein